jgi:hypothetical protein
LGKRSDLIRLRLPDVAVSVDTSALAAATAAPGASAPLRVEPVGAEAERDHRLYVSKFEGLPHAEGLAGSLDEFDKCLIGFLAAQMGEPARPGRIANRLGAIFDEVSVNFVKSRIGALRDLLAKATSRIVIEGDDERGFWIGR